MISVLPSHAFRIRYEGFMNVMIRSIRKNLPSIIDAHYHPPLNHDIPFISPQCLTPSFIAFSALFTPRIQADFKAGASMVDIRPSQYPVGLTDHLPNVQQPKPRTNFSQRPLHWMTAGNKSSFAWLTPEWSLALSSIRPRVLSAKRQVFP